MEKRALWFIIGAIATIAIAWKRYRRSTAKRIGFFLVESPDKELTMLTIKADSNPRTVTVKALDRKGNPAPIEGTFQWNVEGPLSLTVSPDGLTATIAPQGPTGTGVVSVNGDADLSEGVKQIFGTLDVEVLAGEATTIVLSVEPEPELSPVA